MPSLNRRDDLVDIVRQFIVTERKTLPDTLRELKRYLTDRGETVGRGYSVRTLKRFARKHQIRRKVSDDAVDELVRDKVNTIGRSVGVKMMNGYLSSEHGVSLGRSRLLRSMRRVDPDGIRARSTRTHHLSKPEQSTKPYFGQNLYIDTNEKLVGYGVTIVLALDGVSGFIASTAVMPTKNNISIYETVFRPLVEQYGLWDNVLVDKGTEFLLTLYMQMYLKGLTDPGEIRLGIESSYKKMSASLSIRIKRFWRDVNEKVVHPVKNAIEHVQRNMTTEHCFFSLGAVARPLVEFGFKMFTQAWNKHTVSGRGKPIDFLKTSKTTKIDKQLLVDGQEAAKRYTADGSRLEEPRSAFGGDMLANYQNLQEQRDQQFWNVRLPAFQRDVISGTFEGLSPSFLQTHRKSDPVKFLYGSITNKIYWIFEEAVKLHYQTSLEVSQEVFMLE